MPSTSSPWARPDQVGWWAISAVHWVIASTKTRSKKSSSGVTRSPSRRVAPSREPPVASLAAIAAILSSGGGRPGVFGVVALEQRLLLVPLGEEEEDERGAEQDGGDTCGVGELVALQEGGLGGGDDLFAVAGVLRGEVGGAGEGLGQLAFDVLGDLGR